MNRRDAVFAVLALGAAPPAAFTQVPPDVRYVGFLTARSQPVPPARDDFAEAFTLGMRQLGYVEGRNLVIEWRYSDGDYKRLPALAAELARMNVEVVVAYGTAAVQAAQGASGTIPIVIAAAVDPVGSGLIASLARPGGHTTGLAAIAVDLGPKHIELLKAMIPKLSRVAVLINPGNASHSAVQTNVRIAAKHLGIETVAVSARNPNEIAAAFDSAKLQHAGAIIVANDPFFSGQGRLLANASIKHRVPSISIYRDHAIAGGLISYGQNIADYHRQSAAFVDKILRGADPADLPVEQPTKVELCINASTARALGLRIPSSLLARADEIVQ